MVSSGTPYGTFESWLVLPTINQYANMSSSITGLLLGSIVSSKSESESWMTKLLVLLGATLVIAIGGWLFTKPNFSDLESVHRMRKVQEVMASIEERDRQIEDKMVKLWSEVPNESRSCLLHGKRSGNKRELDTIDQQLQPS